MDTASKPNRLIGRTVAPMFRETDVLSEQVTQALLGQPVAVLEARPGWARIRTPDTYQGWVEADALCEAPDGWGEPWAEIDELWANLRAAGEYRRAAAAQATLGVRLPLVGEAPGWVRLLLPDGRRLWTEAKRALRVVRDPMRPRSTAAVCRTARRLMGTPYLWGGSSPFGLDCSGFVQLCMRLHGVELLRDAIMQAGQGAPSDTPDRGDLVFFGPADRPEAITHVGMMLDRTRFIHAAGSDRVRINRLADEPYARELRCARRYLAR